MSNRKATKTSFKKGQTRENHPAWKGGLASRKVLPYKDWPVEKKGKYREYIKIYLRKQRVGVLELLGNKCTKCGFSDTRALQIDHIKAGGSAERKNREYKGTFHANVIKSFLDNENKYQLLCANCNWIKRFDNDERNT